MKESFLLKAILIVTLFAIYSCKSHHHSVSGSGIQHWRYEIEPVGVGTQGTYLVKVWSYSRSSQLSIDKAKRNAIHGIIFKGFSGIPGVPGQRPLATNPNLEHEQAHFFESFFSRTGRHQNFISLTTGGTIQPRDRIRVGNEYKIGIVVSVNVADLRKDLEHAGIIRPLDAGF